jgi:DNA-binding response OmpR family regulator
MRTNPARVLVIEDEPRYRELLELNLRHQGYRVSLAADARGGLDLFERDGPDLVLLDLILPDADGFDVCRQIRDQSQTPIIILSARFDEAQKVRGLRLGADDYVTKPFGADELLARIEAVLRRSAGADDSATPPFVSDGLVVDFARRHVTLDGRDVHLGLTEYRVLHHLALNAGHVMVHEELLRRVWGSAYGDDVALVHNAVRRLRDSLGEDPQQPRHILTRRGFGYLLARGAG